MLLGLSEALPSLVEARFGTAKTSSSLLFSPTEVATIRTSTGVPVRGSALRMHMTRLTLVTVPAAILSNTCKKARAEK